MENILQKFLEEQQEEIFVIETEEQVNEALRKIKAAEDRKQANAELAKAEITKIEAWLKQENSTNDRTIDHYSTLLNAYADRQRAANPKFKSLKLPNGKIGFRKQQDKWSYDDSTLLESLKQLGHNDLIRTKVEANKAEIKKRFKVSDGKVIDQDTGEVIEGITVEHPLDTLKIETV